MNDYQILSKCLDDHCISDKSELIYVCKQVLQFDAERMGSRASVGVKLKCPVLLLHKFFDEYDSSGDFEDDFEVRCKSELKDRAKWRAECEKAYFSDKELGRYSGIGPVFECSKVYSFEDHHLIFVSAWYDPKMGFSGFYYYQGVEELEFKAKHLCTVS